MLPDANQSVEEYLIRCDAAVGGSSPPPEPETREQLLALAERFPEFVWRYWPSRQNCRAMGIPYRHCQRIRPLPSPVRDRLAADIAKNPNYWRPILLHALMQEGDPA